MILSEESKYWPSIAYIQELDKQVPLVDEIDTKVSNSYVGFNLPSSCDVDGVP